MDELLAASGRRTPPAPPWGEAPSTSEGNGSRGLSTARAVLQVLSFVAESPHGVSAREVAARLHKSRSTAYHLLASLEAEGYVCRDGRSGAHHLVPARPGAPAPAPDLDAAEVLDPALESGLRAAMRGVFARTSRRTSIGRLSGGGVAPLAEAGRQGIPRMANLEKPCIRRTAHALAIGKVGLAALDDAALESHLAEIDLLAFTETTIVDPGRLRRELATVRACGVAVDHGEFDADFGSVAASIAGPDGRPAAALAVTVTRAQFATERLTLVRELSAAAGAIADRLGNARPQPVL